MLFLAIARRYTNHIQMGSALTRPYLPYLSMIKDYGDLNKNINFAPKRDNLILGALRPIFSLLLQVQTIHFSAGTLSLT